MVTGNDRRYAEGGIATMDETGKVRLTQLSSKAG